MVSVIIKDMAPFSPSIIVKLFDFVGGVLCEILLEVSCANLATHIWCTSQSLLRIYHTSKFHMAIEMSQALNKIDPSAKLNKGEKKTDRMPRRTWKRDNCFNTARVRKQRNTVCYCFSPLLLCLIER